MPAVVPVNGTCPTQPLLVNSFFPLAVHSAPAHTHLPYHYLAVSPHPHLEPQFCLYLAPHTHTSSPSFYTPGFPSFPTPPCSTDGAGKPHTRQTDKTCHPSAPSLILDLVLHTHTTTIAPHMPFSFTCICPPSCPSPSFPAPSCPWFRLPGLHVPSLHWNLPHSHLPHAPFPLPPFTVPSPTHPTFVVPSHWFYPLPPATCLHTARLPRLPFLQNTHLQPVISHILDVGQETPHETGTGGTTPPPAFYLPHGQEWDLFSSLPCSIVPGSILPMDLIFTAVILLYHMQFTILDGVGSYFVQLAVFPCTHTCCRVLSLPAFVPLFFAVPFWDLPIPSLLASSP